MWHIKLCGGFNLKCSRMVLVIGGGGKEVVVVVVVTCMTSKLRVGGPFNGNWVHTSLLRSDRNTTKCCSRGNSLISSAAPSWIMDRLGLIVFCTVPISHVYSYPRAQNYKMCQCIWLTRLLPTLPSDGTHGLIVVLQDDEEGGMLKSSTVRLHYSNLKVHRIPISFSTVR